MSISLFVSIDLMKIYVKHNKSSYMEKARQGYKINLQSEYF